MPCTLSTACKFLQMESRLSVPGDGRLYVDGYPMWTQRSLFLVTAMIAVHFALRAATIRMQDERFIMAAPLVLAILLATIFGLTKRQYSLIFAAAFATSLISSSAWAFERINEHSAIDFLRDERGYLRYVNDLDVNLIIVALNVLFSTAVGWLLGATVRYTICEPIQRRRPDQAGRTMR